MFFPGMSEKSQAERRNVLCRPKERRVLCYPVVPVELVKDCVALVTLEAAEIRGSVDQKDFEVVLKRCVMH